MKFGPGKLFCVCIRDQSFNSFKSDAIKLEANEAKLTSLWARNCTTGLDFKICLQGQKVTGTFEKPAPRTILWVGEVGEDTK